MWEFQDSIGTVMQEHSNFLLKLCRVCEDYVSSCTTYASDLMMVFGINIATDSPDDSHPASFFYLCHQVVTKYKDTSAHGMVYKL